MFTALFGRKWGTPVWKVNWPFIVGGGVTLALINSIQNKMMASDAYKNDPRNPSAGSKH
ncbi:MAG: ATPase, F0 complex, subunit J [Piptocephalis tieghemiana]|nr:MAG: ATPase, F0 complex, subunit J [Piptocephalis tieghemiana]